VLARWSRAAIPAEFSASDGRRRRRMVGAIAGAIQRGSVERRQRRRVQRTSVVAAAVVGLFLLAGGALHGGGTRWWRARGGWAHTNMVASVRPTPSPSVPNGPVAMAHDLASRLQLASGVEVMVGADTRLSPPDKDHRSDREELVLDAGFVHVDVPKLPPGHSFTVRTPDTLVVVHGTSFSVEVARPGPSALPVTRVVVSVGVVAVRHGESEVLLGPGMEWASSNEAVEPALHRGRTVSALKPEPTASTSRSTRHESTPNSSPAPEPAVAATDLAEQNHSFAEAMLARERGDLAGAVRILDSFARRYPGSPLAQDASVERFRALARLGDHAAAAREARRYLTLYQNGFARDEARSLALEPTGKP
jgi:hypothetical protein